MRWMLLVLVMACAKSTPSPQTPPPPVPPNPSLCAAFCDTLTELECPTAKGSPGPDEEYETFDDQSCFEVCSGVMKSGLYKGDADCLNAANTCQRAEYCLFGD